MNRTKMIKVRVSETEEQKIKHNAEKAGLNMSDYIRRSAISENFTVADNAALYRLSTDIRAIGRNVNKIARVVNSCNSSGQKDISDLQIHIGNVDKLVSDNILDLRNTG